MINNEYVDGFTKINKLYPTFSEYLTAKGVVELYNKIPSDIKGMKFYVDMGFDYYAVGTFGGIDGDTMLVVISEENKNWIEADIENVYETKQDFMLHEHLIG